MDCILPSRRMVVAFLSGLIAAVVVAVTFFAWEWVFAETATVEPVADVQVAATPVGCGGGGNYDCLNDGVLEPDSPDTGSDYLDFENGDEDFYLVDDLPNVDTVTEITVWLYHNNTGNTNLQFEIGLYSEPYVDDPAETQYVPNQLIPQRTSAQWDSVTFTDLSLTQEEFDNLNLGLLCDRESGGQPGGCRAYAMYADVTYEPFPNITAGSIGEQQQVEAGVNDQYIGGAFTFLENIDTSQIQGVTFTDTGNIDLSSLSSVRMYYDLDTTTPYDCSSVEYDGTQPLFGSAGTFDTESRTITFTDDVTVTTTQSLCAYLVVDVDEDAESGTSFEPEISDPQSDVSFDTLFIEPDTAVALSGFSGVLRTNLTQIGYHWRNDDGSETDATSATEGVENTTFDAAPREQTLRLRMAVSNEGNLESESKSYQLEYGTRVTTCAEVAEWEAVDSAGALWTMSPTTNLSDGADTTNIAVSTGGITDPNDVFLTPNSGVRDTNAITGPLTLSDSEFVELEYAIEATEEAGDGVEYCFRVTDDGASLDTYDIYPQATTFSDLTVSAVGEQVATVDIPSSDVYSGGTFRVTDQTIGAHEIQSVTIAATGTADVESEIGNLRLFYDLDTTAPYDCSSESYSGTESQYGSTLADGFGSSNTATFTGSVSVDPEQSLCLYVVYDIHESTEDGGTVNFRINNPAEDIVVDQGDIGPSGLVALDGETTFIETLVSQTNYHWRNNDGSETDATSATFGEPDTPLEQLRIEAPTRLRLAVANAGGRDADPKQYRLEWARRVSTCAAVNDWEDVGAAGGAWQMSPSENLTNGEDTTNIATSSGGVPDPQPTFITPNGGVRDTESQTGDITLTSYSFVELEYSIEATAEATEGGEYCFRVTDDGTELSNYDTYPQVTISEPTDFFVQRGFLDISGTTATIDAGLDYEAPDSNTTAFIRITNTLNTGAGGQQDGNANDVTVRVANPDNITDSITFERPASAGGETRVAWEIIEFVGSSGGQNEIIVRDQGTVTYGDTDATVSTPAVAGVENDENVAVFITGQRNPDTDTNYQLGNSTAEWDAGGSVATFTRGATGNASGLSYAVVEFRGTNWQIQRSEHTYTEAGSTETESIDPVNSLSRAFVHTQKRMGDGQNTHGDFGHQVWLSGIGQVSYLLDSTASDPTTHTSVAWVIENTQIAGDRMEVTRSSGTQSGGDNPTLLAVNIGKTLDDLEVASIFMNNTGDEPGFGGGQNAFPDPLMSARIISLTQYELYIASTRGSRSWRTEVVEWPTAARTFTQNYYRFYANNDQLTPDTPWPEEEGETVGENSPILLDNRPVGQGQSFRLRMSVEIDAAGKVPGIDAFTLQYAERATTCSAVSEWNDVDGPNDSSLWRGSVTPVEPGTPLSSDPPDPSDLLLSVSDVAATYEEGSPSDFTPYAADPGENIEFDWSIEHNGAEEETEYCFRMIESNGLEFIEYNFYPRLLTAAYVPVVDRWRWYGDADALTPTEPEADEEVMPIDLMNTERYKLRVNVAETAGAPGENVKFALQYSEYSDFRDVSTLTATTTCAEDSLWCYAEGAGENNQIIDSAVLTGSDTCTDGVGDGCGTYNTGTSTTGLDFTHQPFATTEYEFTLQHAGARANAVYYFRLYDLTNDEPVTASSSNPSAMAEGAQLVFSVDGLPAGTSTAGITTDVSTSPDSLNLTGIPLNQPHFAAHRLSISTNATEGYQVFKFASQDPINSYGDIIPPIDATNANPAGWETACDLATNTGCLGYHTTDATLEDGSTRFSAHDTYAAFHQEPAEVMYSPVPTDDVHDIVYQVEVTAEQPAGDYQSDIAFVAIPRF